MKIRSSVASYLYDYVLLISSFILITIIDYYLWVHMEALWKTFSVLWPWYWWAPGCVRYSVESRRSCLSWWQTYNNLSLWQLNLLKVILITRPYEDLEDRVLVPHIFGIIHASSLCLWCLCYIRAVWRWRIILFTFNLIWSDLLIQSYLYVIQSYIYILEAAIQWMVLCWHIPLNSKAEDCMKIRCI